MSLSAAFVSEALKVPKKKRRVLLANDNDFLLKIYGYALEPHFAEICKCVNGRIAVEMVTTHPVNYFDMIILDIDMPALNGKEACIQILEHYSKVKDNRSSEKKETDSDGAIISGREYSVE
jgi:CheY-like chemotaxis protein